jgi:hypothetical protein
VFSIFADSSCKHRIPSAKSMSLRSLRASRIRQRKRSIFHLDQRRRRLHFSGLLGFFVAGGELGHPYLSVRIIRIAFTISARQSWANPFHLIKADHHAGVIQSCHQLVALRIDIGRTFVCNLTGVAAQRDRRTRRGSKKGRPNA